MLSLISCLISSRFRFSKARFVVLAALFAVFVAVQFTISFLSFVINKSCGRAEDLNNNKYSFELKFNIDDSVLAIISFIVKISIGVENLSKTHANQDS